MSTPIQLSDRYQTILRATIQHYIATAEPVGSKTLLEEYNFPISSATIRNALGQLEKAGLLYQPHISAGRIPSDWGYRIYVDQLLTVSQKTRKTLERKLHQTLKEESRQFEGLLQRATQLLANLTGYIALITFPQTSTVQLRHLQLLPLANHQVMIILVTDSYHTQSVLMELPVELANSESPEALDQELQILSNFLNHKLRGKTLSQLANLNWSEIDQDFIHYTDFLKTFIQQLSPFFQPQTTMPMAIHGVSEVIRQPEFSQLEQIQMLLHLLEQEQDQLFPLVFEQTPGQDYPKTVTIRIGSENPLESMRPCTLVSAFYYQGTQPVGSVGVIGPTRMLYEQAISLVESTADYLSEVLAG
ncbi:MAG: heat-inducible transcriptional repressor HrcA [Microcystaceae cyanobacterium]